MATKTKAKAKKSSKPKPGKAPASAEELKALEEASKPVVIPALTRSVEEIVRDRVTMLDGSIGLELAPETTIEESLAVLGWTMSLNAHSGFMIGDVLNFSATKFGEKYTRALQQTNKALSTLKGYAEAARRIPADKRVAALSFTHHRELIRLPDSTMEKVLADLGKKAEKGEAPSTKEVRIKVMNSMPRKKKTTGKATSGKGKKKGKVKDPPPPYVPDAEEQSKMDSAEEAIVALAEQIKESKLFTIVGKMDYKEKQRWCDMVEPIVVFYNAVDRVKGYPS